MNNVIKIIFQVFFICVFFQFLSCSQSADLQQDNTFHFNSFRDVPGITYEEIKAIEALQRKTDYFVYGMPQSTEAFTNIYGEIRGFSDFLCQWMTELFEIPFRPKIFDWSHLLAGLDSGEIAFTGELTANEERMRRYHMTTDIASRLIKCFRIAGSRSIEDITSSRLLKCGFIESATTINTVTAELVPGSYETVLLSDVSLVYDALKSGQIDVFYYSGTIEVNFIENSDIVVSDFYPLIYRPVSLTTAVDELKPIISVMEKILKNGGLRYLTEMYNRGEHEYLMYKLHIQLTPAEREYIRSNPVVPIAVDPGNYPDSFYDRREKEWKGIFIDILNEMTSLTGLKFEQINNEEISFSEVYQMLIDGNAALAPSIIQSDERRDRFLWPEETQITDYYSLISNSDYPDIKVNEVLYVKVGLVKDTAYASIFKKWFHNHMNTIEYDNIGLAFDALQRGEIDMLMATQRRLLYLTHYLELPNYKTNIVFNYAAIYKFAFNTDWEMLCSVFNKALGLIDIKSITDRWMRQTYDYRIKLIEARRPLFAGLSVLFLAVLTLIAVLFTRSRLIGKKLENLVEIRTRDLEMQTTTLNALFDSIPDIIFTLDSNLCFTRCNKKFLEHLGLTKEEIIGKDENSLNFPPDIIDKHNKCNRSVIEEHKIVALEECVPGADGTSPFFETIKSPILLDSVNIGVLGIARNITKRKEMEEAALTASHAKSAFLANMSHEIRTPMNSIMGFSELAMDSADIPKIKEYLGKIRTNSEWLLQIINNILDISKIESGRMELENIPFDLHDLFTSCRSLVLPKAVEKGLVLHFYAEPSLGKVPLGDPTRLRQVFINFLSNSVKFTNSGIVKLFAKITNSTDKTLTMHFEIKDSGIGMTPDQIEKIFEPFIQGESGITRKYGGTGLGLAITKNIIEMMGGKIEIESTPKVGTIFSFDLTFDTIDKTTDSIKGRILEHVEIEKPTFKGEILLCEDNTMNQEVISEHLARVGLKTIIAENGKIGLENVQNRIKNNEKIFDLIFMDIHMPVMDGIEASAKILELTTDVPIIAMTANIMSTDKDIYLASGMSGCIGKPFTSQELWHCLMKYLTPIDDKINTQKDAKTLLNKDFIKKIQYLFLKENKTKYKEITEALKADDFKLAHRLVHTLKSNAGQIGKTLLQEAAGNIERQLKSGKNQPSEKQLRVLEAELYSVINELMPLEEEYREKPSKTGTAQPDKEGIRRLLAELEPLLKTGNSECLKFIDDLKLVPGCKYLIHYIEDYEFNKASAELELLKKYV